MAPCTDSPPQCRLLIAPAPVQPKVPPRYELTAIGSEAPFLPSSPWDATESRSVENWPWIPRLSTVASIFHFGMLDGRLSDPIGILRVVASL